MLEEKDIQKIGEEMGKVIEHNIMPVLDDMRKDLDEVKIDLSEVKIDLSEVKTDLNKVKMSMVTKSYLDDKLADLEGNLVTKLRKEDEKMNRLIDVLHDKSILSEQDVEQLRQFQIFPRT